MWTATATGGTLTVSGSASGSVHSVVPACPAPPTIVSVGQEADSVFVAWTPDAASIATSTAVTVAPAVAGGGSGANLSATAVSFGAGNASIAGLQPSTPYSVTAVSINACGASAPSAPVAFTSQAATTPPGAPSITNYWWAGNLAVASWAAAPDGNSPTDNYELSAAPAGGGRRRALQGGQAGGVAFSNSSTVRELWWQVPDPTASSWSLAVRAHNAAGWGPWSQPATLAGL